MPIYFGKRGETERDEEGEGHVPAPWLEELDPEAMSMA
jgi:hypothetical protein